VSALYFGFALLWAVLGISLWLIRGRPTPVAPAVLSAEKHNGKYITLQTNMAVEAGYRYRDGDKQNKIARLLAVPINDKLLIVQVSLDHTGSSYTGIVSEMPLDVQSAVSSESLSSLSKSLDDRRKAWKEIKLRPGSGGVVEIPEVPPLQPTLNELVLPIFLDTTDQDFGVRVLMLILTIGFASAGLVTLIRANRAREAPQKGLVGSAGSLEHRVCSICGADLRYDERKTGLCANCHRKSL
jgi:hypothetical protein